MGVSKVVNTTNSIGGAIIKLRILPVIIIATFCLIFGLLDVTKKIIFKKSLDGNVLNDVCIAISSPGPSPGPSPSPVPEVFECKDIKYTYKIDGKNYSKTSTISSNIQYKSNDPILISYNPNNPEEHRIGSADNRVFGMGLIICAFLMYTGSYFAYKMASQKGVGTVVAAGTLAGMFKGGEK